jgi:hypothetical protein
MNIKIFLLLVITGAFFITACENPKTENVVVNQNQSESSQNYKTEDNQNPANISGSVVNAPANENTTAGADKPEINQEKADFAGTAGITNKKNQVKGVAVLRDVRAGQHANYDRVVFEFETAEMPSYHIEYVDKPVRACGSGHVVPLKGDGWLAIRFTPAAAHTEEGKATVKNRSQALNFKIIKEMKSTCDFEAEVEWVLGVASPNKYRALELKNPTRLAVDIKH